MLIAEGSVALVQHRHGSMRVEVAKSREALVLRLLCETSIVDTGWASDEHVAALERIRARLEAALVSVRCCRIEEPGDESEET